MKRRISLALRRLSLLLVVLGLLAGQAGLSSAAVLCAPSPCAPAASCDMALDTHDCCCSVSEAPPSAVLRVDAPAPSFHLGLAVHVLVTVVVEPTRPSRVPVAVPAPVRVLLAGPRASRAPPSPSASLS